MFPHLYLSSVPLYICSKKRDNLPLDIHVVPLSSLFPLLKMFGFIKENKPNYEILRKRYWIFYFHYLISARTQVIFKYVPLLIDIINKTLLVYKHE